MTSSDHLKAKIYYNYLFEIAYGEKKTVLFTKEQKKKKYKSAKDVDIVQFVKN